MRFKIVDILTFSYIGILSLLITLFRSGVEGWYLYIMVHCLYSFLIVFLIWLDKIHQNKLLSLLRYGYPLLSFPLMYEELGQFIHLIFPYWFDFVIHRLELSIFHTHPTIWLQKVTTPWATEYFKCAYFSYYLVVPIAALSLYLKGDMKIFEELITTLAFVFYICYIGFILLPVEGPRYALASLYTIKLKGYSITNFQDLLTEFGALHGGCMPSSHVAAALVSLITTRRYVKVAYYFLLPAVLSLFISTVYTRDHYLSDVIVGLLVGWFGLFLVPKMMKIYGGS